MADLIEIDFPEDDEPDSPYEQLTLRVPFKKNGKLGHEDFTAVAEIPFGVIIDFEASQSSRGIEDFLDIALLTDDGKCDKDGEQIDGTSSRDRYDTLVHDPDRRVPGSVLGKAFERLLATYGARHGAGEATERPTQPYARSRARQRRTGSISTAKPSSRASTSARSRQAAG